MINLCDSLVLEKMPIVGARAIGVLVAISKFMNEHNQAWPSRKTLRAITGLGRDALDKDIALLERHQLARKIQRRTDDGRRLSSNRYTIPFRIARKYTPPQDTETQGTGSQDTEFQHTDFQDTGFQHPENPPGSIEYPFEVLDKQEELNKQEELRALCSRAREEAENLKQENEKLRRELENLQQEKESYRQEAESLHVRLRLCSAGVEAAPPPGSGAPPPRRWLSGAEASGEAEPEADGPSCRLSEAEAKNHTQAAETFWSWALDNGYLPGIIANARYPGSEEQARECCSDYFRNHQKNGRWIYIWKARSSKNLAGFESWLVKDPLFYPKKYQNGQTVKTNGGILSEESARRVYATLLAEEGIVPVGGFPGAT
ncbi:MAG: hypothetical protein J5I94_09345 [Phaeodactylibacter sp.]|nr:hypothetical protein [Phaeodactylibacter sp.]